MEQTAIPTSAGPKTAEQVVDFLTYRSYAHNRRLGMRSEQAVGFFPEAGKLEERFQREYGRAA